MHFYAASATAVRGDEITSFLSGSDEPLYHLDNSFGFWVVRPVIGLASGGCGEWSKKVGTLIGQLAKVASEVPSLV